MNDRVEEREDHFHLQLANIHQRLRHSTDQEAKYRLEIEQMNHELNQMKVRRDICCSL